MSSRLAAAVAAAALAAAGCGATTPAVDLGAGWPAQAGDYDAVHAAWTRQGEIQRDYQLVADASATLLSPAWRAAWVARRARVGQLPEGARAELLAEQQQRAAGAVEVLVTLSTWDRRENDLDRGERSVWRLVLVDGEGREHAPLEVRSDRRPDRTIRAELPAHGDFARTYLVRFSPDARVFDPGVARVELRLSQPRGAIVLAWGSTR